MTQAHVFVMLSPFALLLSITCIIFALVNKQKGRFNSLIAFLAETACITLFSALELTASSKDMLLLFSRLTYTCVIFIPISWLYFCVEYTFGEKSTRWLFPAWVIPAITLLIVWIPELQYLLWKKHEIISQNEGLFNNVIAYGAWFWIHAGYCYLLYFTGIALILRDFFLLDKSKRHQSMLNILGVSVPVAVNLLYVFRLIPGIQRDFSVLVFSVSGLTFLVSITRYRLLDPGLIEYTQVVNTLPKAVIIIDRDCVIQGINDQAEKLLKEVMEKPLHGGDRLPIQPDFLMIQTRRGKTAVLELQLGEKPLKAEITPIILNKAGLPGYTAELLESEPLRPNQMSRRELDVFDLLSQGCSTKEIAARLCISENTAKTHIKHIYEKTNVNSRKAFISKDPNA